MFPKLYVKAQRVWPTQTLNQTSDLNCNPDLSHVNNYNSNISKKMFYQFITNYNWNSQACVHSYSAVLLTQILAIFTFQTLISSLYAHLEQSHFGLLN